MDIVTDTGAVRCGVVVPVDVGHLTRDQTLEDQREEVVRAGVRRSSYPEPTTLKYRSEVWRSGAGRTRGTGLVAKQPLADQLGFAVRGLRMRRVLFADQVGGSACRRPRRWKKTKLATPWAAIDSSRVTMPVTFWV